VHLIYYLVSNIVWKIRISQRKKTEKNSPSIFSFRQLLYSIFTKLNHLTPGLIHNCWIKYDNCRAQSTLQIQCLLWNFILFIDDLQLVFICTLVDVSGVRNSPQSSCVLTGKPMVNISARLLHFVIFSQEEIIGNFTITYFQILMTSSLRDHLSPWQKAYRYSK